MDKKHVRKIVIMIVFLLTGVCYSCNNSAVEEFSLLEEMDSEAKEPILPVIKDKMEETISIYDYVYICGEVHSPGVYRMESGSRIFEVIDQAGGLTALADPTQLNLAQIVNDGMKIVVLSAEEAERLKLSGNGSEIEIQQDTKVNLNVATKEQLMTLKGIGESRAEDIIRYRETHGPFKKIEDIMQVSGIKESAFQKIKDYVTV